MPRIVQEQHVGDYYWPICVAGLGYDPKWNGNCSFREFLCFFIFPVSLPSTTSCCWTVSTKCSKLLLAGSNHRCQNQAPCLGHAVRMFTWVLESSLHRVWHHILDSIIFRSILQPKSTHTCKARKHREQGTIIYCIAWNWREDSYIKLSSFPHRRQRIVYQYTSPRSHVM